MIIPPETILSKTKNSQNNFSYYFRVFDCSGGDWDWLADVTTAAGQSKQQLPRKSLKKLRLTLRC